MQDEIKKQIKYDYCDTEKPLNFDGLFLRERHGYTEAVCPGCQSWVRITHLYQSDRYVIRGMPHNFRCEYYENLFGIAYRSD